MTNKEILQANLLDIVFEHRNKNYGAYALRKTYPQRLQWALGTCLGISLLLLMINFIGKNDRPNNSIDKGFIQLTDVNIDKPKEPERQEQRTQKQVSTVKATDNIQITNTQTVMPTQEDFENSNPSTDTHTGTAPTLDTTTTTTGTGNTIKTDAPQTEFHPSHSEAEFPMGKDGFAKFLQKWLEPPEELELGQQQKVLAKFKVDVDGSISDIQIVQSGGEKFDKEVIRVLKKMPKWKPALQNGIPVPVYFTQVVIFVGQEQ